MADRCAEIREIITELLKDNCLEPSTIFINNKAKIYRLSKDEFVKAFTPISTKTIGLLREQIFYIFLDSFSEETLIENGFLITDTELKNHICKRIKHENAIVDIYNMGLSIHEEKIVQKLDDIYRSSNQTQNKSNSTYGTQPIMSIDTKEMLNQITDLVNTVKSVKQENEHLKKQLELTNSKLENTSTKLDQLFHDFRQLQNKQEQPTSTETIPQQSNNKSYQQPIFGTGIPCPHITGEIRPLSIFLGGLNKNLTDEEVRNFISDEIVAPTNIELIKENQYNKSYRIDFQQTDKDKVLEPKNWPEGLIIRHYRKPKRHRNQYHHPANRRPNVQQHGNRTPDENQYPQNKTFNSNRYHDDKSPNSNCYLDNNSPSSNRTSHYQDNTRTPFRDRTYDNRTSYNDQYHDANRTPSKILYHNNRRLNNSPYQHNRQNRASNNDQYYDNNPPNTDQCRDNRTSNNTQYHDNRAPSTNRHPNNKPNRYDNFENNIEKDYNYINNRQNGSTHSKYY